MVNRAREGGSGGTGRGGAAPATALFALALFASVAAASGLSDIPAAFVDVGIGAREMGMAGAAVASTSGPTAVFWNPARLADPAAGNGVALTHGEQMGLVPYSAAAGSWRASTNWIIGAGAIYSGDDALSEMTGVVSAARSFGSPAWLQGGDILAGLSLRARRASFGNNESSGAQVTGSAVGAAVDAGIVIPLAEGVSLGACGRDIVGVLNWDSSSSGAYEEGVPPALIVGLAFQILGDAVLEADLDKALSLDGRDLLALGLEVPVFDVAALRGGYRKDLGNRNLEEFSVGGGASVPAACAELELDVAYVFGELDDTLRLGVGLRF